MPSLVRHLFLDALGYDATGYKQEDDSNDIRSFDNERNPLIILEGKNET